jgi:hypothetical protein
LVLSFSRSLEARDIYFVIYLKFKVNESRGKGIPL